MKIWALKCIHNWGYAMWCWADDRLPDHVEA